jgi:hypothetical protein
VIELTFSQDVNNLIRLPAAIGSDNGEEPMQEMTLDQLLPAYRDSLVRFAESYAHRSSEAEDVVQDVFVRIIRAETARTEGGLRHYDRPGAYLRRAVANERLALAAGQPGAADRRAAGARRRRSRRSGDRPIVVGDAVAAAERMRQVITLSFLREWATRMLQPRLVSPRSPSAPRASARWTTSARSPIWAEADGGRGAVAPALVPAEPAAPGPVAEAPAARSPPGRGCRPATSGSTRYRRIWWPTRSPSVGAPLVSDQIETLEVRVGTRRSRRTCRRRR